MDENDNIPGQDDQTPGPDDQTPMREPEVRPLSDIVAGEAPPPLPRKSTRLIVASIIAAVALVGVGVGVALKASTTEPALDTLVPANTAVFAVVHVSPSGQQRAALRDLIDRLPDAQRDKVGERVDSLLDDMVDGSGLDYTKDVKPWLGGQVAVAVAEPAAGGGEQSVVGLLAVKDESAARDALRRASERDDASAYEVADGVAYLANEQASIDALQADVAKGALASDDAYQRAAEGVGGEDTLVLAWLNGEKLGAFAQGFAGNPLARGPIPGGFESTGALSLRATDAGLEVVGRFTVADGTSQTRKGKPELLESMPANILGAMTLFDLGGIVEAVLKSSGEQGSGPTESARAFVQQGLGLDLEKDLLPWLHGEFTVVVGGFTAGPIPDAGIVIDATDTAALDRTMRALALRAPGLGDAFGAEIVAESGGLTVKLPDQGATLVVRREGRRLVIASSRAYAQTLLNAGAERLGADAVYRRVVGETGDGTAFALYVRVDRVVQLVEAFAGSSEGFRESAPFLRSLEALAMTATVEGTQGEFRVVLSVKNK